MTSFGDQEAELRNWLVDYLVTNIGCSPDQIDPDAPLNELGVGSRDAVVLSGELSELLRRPVSPVDFWQNPTLNSLAYALVHPDAEPAGAVPGATGSLAERADRRHRAGLPAAGRHSRTRRAVGLPGRGPLSGGNRARRAVAGVRRRLTGSGGGIGAHHAVGLVSERHRRFRRRVLRYHAAGSRPHRSTATPTARGRRRGARACRHPGRIAPALADRGLRRRVRQRIRVHGVA